MTYRPPRRQQVRDDIERDRILTAPEARGYAIVDAIAQTRTQPL